MLEIVLLKVSRCGSTLLENLLRAARPDAVILHEPRPVTRFLMGVAIDSSSIEVAAILRGILEELVPCFASVPVIINCSSQVSRNLSRIVPALRLLGNPRICFLWRSPVEVALSHKKKPAPWVRRFPEDLRDFIRIAATQALLLQKELEVFHFQDIRHGYALRTLVPGVDTDVLLGITARHSKRGGPFQISEDHVEADAPRDLVRTMGFLDEAIDFGLHCPPFPIARVLATVGVQPVAPSPSLYGLEPICFVSEKHSPAVKPSHRYCALRCVRPNYFVWHKATPEERRPLSSWTTCTHETYSMSPDLMIIDKHAQNVTIRFSHKGAVTSLHYDMGGRILYQVKGAKRVFLFPPQVPLKWYPLSDGMMARRSLYDMAFWAPDSPSLEEHVRVVDLPESHALYIPPLWGHYIVTLQESCTVVERTDHAISYMSTKYDATQEEIASAEADPWTCLMVRDP